MVEKTYVGG